MKKKTTLNPEEEIIKDMVAKNGLENLDYVYKLRHCELFGHLFNKDLTCEVCKRRKQDG